MDTPITKRLIISGLTTSITVDDISRRLTTFGTVKATDGFGLTDGIGQPRKFAYVTLETTTGKLAKCMNLLSGSTWKGAKLRFGEAKPDFKERIALENKAAAEGPPPKKRRRRAEGSQAEDMSLVTAANANDRKGWQVSSLGRITRPAKMRPLRPLPEPPENSTLKTNVGTTEREKKDKKKKRLKVPDSRARRRTIDMTKWGSVHLKGMFLDMPSLGTKRLKLDDFYDLQNEKEEESEQEIESPLASTKSTDPSTKLKDLFAPREEEAGFSLLGHLDLDLELDNEIPFLVEQPSSTTQDQTPAYTPLPSTTLPSHSSHAAPIVLNPKQALFFPYPQQQEGIQNKARQKDIFDLIKDNHWNWRDPLVGFYRTGTEDDIRKRWEEGKGGLTKEWKKRSREAGKANRWKRNDPDIGA